MGKTILHFFDPIMTARVGRPGVTVNENTGEVEQTIPEKRIAPTGYYTIVDVGIDTHMYYRGIEYEPIGNGRNIQFKQAWELTTEEVFEYQIMFGRVNVTHYYNDNVRRIDHYLRLNVDNTEIVNILKKHNAPKECLYDP